MIGKLSIGNNWGFIYFKIGDVITKEENINRLFVMDEQGLFKELQFERVKHVETVTDRNTTDRVVSTIFSIKVKGIIETNASILDVLKTTPIYAMSGKYE